MFFLERRQEIQINGRRVEPVRQDSRKSSAQTSSAKACKNSSQNATAQKKRDSSLQGITKNASAKPGDAVTGSKQYEKPALVATSTASRRQDDAKKTVAASQVRGSSTGAMSSNSANNSSPAATTFKNLVAASIKGSTGNDSVIAASEKGLEKATNATNNDMSRTSTFPKPRHYSGMDMKDADKLIANLISMSSENRK